MKFSRPALLSLWLLLGSLPLPTLAGEPCTLLVYGDSLSASYGIDPAEGWVALLATRLKEQHYSCRVVNASVSGETSSGGLARLAATLQSHQPDLVLLELGGNDGLRGLPLTHLKQNLLAMIRSSRDAGAEVLLAGIRIPPNYGPRYTEPFASLFGEIAQEQALPLVPFLLEGIAQHPELMQDDGIHPTARAQRMIVENVWPYLEPMLQEIGHRSD